ncbi:hypothetical protein HPC38_01595 [Pasteurellaceae bacterium HPA106]|nr:hypothetical protein [Spirabiliibacterium pneumoniae]MBE2895569.1 hypothetical protein [Spirabiliibacterium pneumoniae]
MFNGRIIGIQGVAIAVLILLNLFASFQNNNQKAKLDVLETALSAQKKQNLALYAEVLKNRDVVAQFQQQQTELISALREQQAHAAAHTKALKQELENENNQSWADRRVPAGIARVFNQRGATGGAQHPAAVPTSERVQGANAAHHHQ